MPPLLKDTTTGPLVWDTNQFDHFVADWEVLGESILDVLEREPNDPYRQAVEFKRAEIKDLCRRILDAMVRSEPRTVLFGLPLAQARSPEQ